MAVEGTFPFYLACILPGPLAHLAPLAIRHLRDAPFASDLTCFGAHWAHLQVAGRSSRQWLDRRDPVACHLEERPSSCVSRIAIVTWIVVGAL